MATTTITALTGGSALGGTEVAPFDQSGSTVKITATQIKTWTSDSPTLVTPTLGVATATSINKVTITAPATSATLTIADGKTLTANNSLTLAGTDSTTMTFPTTSATIARTDASNTFTGKQTITPAANENVIASTGYSLTGSNAQAMLDLAGTWNTSGNPVAIKVAITNTASGSSSKFLSLLAGAAGATEVVYIDKAGQTVTTLNDKPFIDYTGGAYVGVGRNSAVGGTNIWGNNSAHTAWVDSTTFALRSTCTFGWSSSVPGNNSNDVMLKRSAAATLQQGAADAASPVDQILQAQGSRSGTDSNVAGANYTIRSGAGTGDATPSTLILQSYVAVASGSGAQTATTGATINTGGVDLGVGGISFPTSDPHIAGRWWDNAGTLTKSSG